MKKIELLAPVASKEGLKAVINAGADAVYIGGMKFGARAYADNLSREDMIEAIKYAHLFNVKIYMTVNVLLKEEEIEQELYDYIKPFYEAGLDGVIVQDLGVMAYLDTMFPDLEKHASTQMTLVSSDCKNLMNMYNVTRIVPARELSIKEIQEIKDNTDLEVEVFIHGALCYCYSGQCLMSSMIGERSGNRGRCAQPCRKQYNVYTGDKLIAKDEYMLSPKDLCGLYNLHNLIAAGVDSLKIEGRMKKIEYAACIVSTYRKYIDLYYALGHDKYIKYIENNEDAIKVDIINMQDMYNRGGYTKGYYNKHNGKDIMSIKLPSHYGTYVGKVTRVGARNIDILLAETVNRQDVLQVRDEECKAGIDNSYEFTLKEDELKGNIITCNYSKGLKLNKGQNVYRIKNNVLIDDINERYIKNNKKIKLDMTVRVCKNQPITVGVKIYDKEYSFQYSEPDESINRPITLENIKKQFGKISDTNFQLDNISIVLDDGLFVPVGKLNEIRRDVISKTEEMYVAQYYKCNAADIEDVDIRGKSNMKEEQFVADVKKTKSSKSIKDSLTVLVADKERLNYIVNYIQSMEDKLSDRRFVDKQYGDEHLEEHKRESCSNVSVNEESIIEYSSLIKINKVYIELDGLDKDVEYDTQFWNNIETLKTSNIGVYIALPRIMRKSRQDIMNKNYKAVFKNEHIDGYMVRNIEGIEYVKQRIDRDVNIVMDSNMYITNSYAACALKEYGAKTLTHSLELTKEETEGLNQAIDNRNYEIECELVVYTRPVVMVSAGCLKKTKDMCDKNKEILRLKDKYNETYLVRSACDYCYNVIYNANTINVISYAEGLADSYRIEFLSESWEEICSVLDGVLDNNLLEDGYKGHFYKATL